MIGAGKSALARALKRTMQCEGVHTYWLDGDDLRKGYKCISPFRADRHE
ncbi:adenylyl-sulfate kinase [Alicyclobacillus dauci]